MKHSLPHYHCLHYTSSVQKAINTFSQFSTMLRPDNDTFLHREITGLRTMAGTGSSAGRTSPDYERQYQEDLERARALSLESLALEKFWLQKQQQHEQFQCISSSSKGGHSFSYVYHKQ